MEPQNVFSGYSACARGNGLLTIVQATWIVPKVSCPALVNYPRAAVWVGLWGSMPSVANGTAWLPQIGTASQCNRDINGNPVPGTFYFPVWEMETFIKGQGNTPQGITSMTINPGDKMVGSVEYEGPDKSNFQHFSLVLDDVTVNAKKPGSDEVTIRTATTEPVKDLSTILQQGGAVVEGATSLKTKLGNVWANGLAQFKTPIPLTHVQVGSAFAGSRSPASVGYVEWVYKDQSGQGHPMAINSKLTGSMYGSLAGFTVTWKRTT
ncbi:MAG TPA: G1 family glutamic endopeptidase [Streptosporangiaceae bacterium]|nr:G1 family glutamic endopeptidase [Streptosporangiaceae bacterium]